MPINFDKALNIHSSSLALRAQRAEVIAANLANTDTPNYLARDIDFQTVLASAAGHSQLRRTDNQHLPISGSASQQQLYRVPNQPAIDGNTVDEHQEKALFSDNAVRYQASLRLLDSRIKGLLSAIRGE